MKSKLLIISVVALTLVLSGCGNTNKNEVSLGDVADTYNAAQELNDDMDNPNKISSDESIENLYTIMNYNGSESKEAMKTAISQGVDDGKNQGELDEEIILKQDLSTAYMVGYIFGCKAVTGDEDMCNDDMGEKYQVIMMKEIQKQFPSMTTEVQ